MSAEPDWMNHYQGENRGWRIIDTPKPAWKLEVVKDGFSIVFNDGRPVPNAFHRMVQRLVLGFKWTRLPISKAPS